MKKFLMIFLMVCMVVSSTAVSAFATTSYPPLPNVSEDFDGWYLVVKNTLYDKVFCWVGGGSNLTFTVDDNDILTGYGTKIGYTQYELVDGKWGVLSQVASNSSSINLGNVTNYDIYVCTHDIYNEDGTLFFPEVPLTLTETVEELTAEQTMRVQNQTVGVMKILVPCGVGCLALLMALPVLRKGFLRFLH